mmetsp:Transcript_15565/g.25778  ORF Transcript_15565/g.25778 Transcript_15565/m.25778 type:complete len:405 (+) Transcript_15565:9-1223(+)
MTDHLHCIFFAEFDNVVGPRVAHQAPREYLTQEVFDAVSEYVIPKPQLAEKLITVCALDVKIVCLPHCLEQAKYARNALLFTVGFVFSEGSATTSYEPVVRKLATYFRTLEIETEFISRKETRSKIGTILHSVWEQLTSRGECCIRVDSANTINLKLAEIRKEPPVVCPHQVPVPLCDLRKINMKEWDLFLQQIAPHVNGLNSIKKIAKEADAEASVVCKCVQQMIYYGLASVVDIFQYSNEYAVCDGIQTLWEEPPLQNECLQYVTANRALPAPSFPSVFRAYCAMKHGVCVRDLCAQLNLLEENIQPRRLVVFGVIKGIIRRVHKYIIRTGSSQQPPANAIVPLVCTGPDNQPAFDYNSLATLYRLADGSRSDDEICCEFLRSWAEIEELIKGDHDFVCVSK